MSKKNNTSASTHAEETLAAYRKAIGRVSTPWCYTRVVPSKRKPSRAKRKEELVRARRDYES